MHERLSAIIAPVCASEDAVFVDLELVREYGDDIIRLIVDTETGISLDTCADISRELSDILLVELEDKINYRLEVSSPGIDRSLDTAEAMEAAIGTQVKVLIKTDASDFSQPITGRIDSVLPETLTLTTHEQSTRLLPRHTILKAWRLKSDGDNP